MVALERLLCPYMDSRADSMHVRACPPVTLLGPVAHACDSHERSSRFFVMLVHRTYTSIRGTNASESLASGIGCSVIASFLVTQALESLVQHRVSCVSSFSSFGCSSVSVHQTTFRSDVGASSSRLLSHKTAYNISFCLVYNIRLSARMAY